MKYSVQCNESSDYCNRNKIQAYMSSGVVMVESINGDLLVMTSDGMQRYSCHYSFEGVVVKCDIPGYTVGQKYTFYNNYFNVVDCEMILNPIIKRERGYFSSDYENGTRVRPRTIQDIRDEKLTKIGI